LAGSFGARPNWLYGDLVLSLEITYDGLARRITPEGTQVRIGRDPECEIFLSGDPTISRLHAYFSASPQNWIVADAGSRNGTHLNGVALREPAILRVGDIVTIAAYRIMVLATSEEPLAETATAVVTPERTIPGLSKREVEIVELVAYGLTDNQIAERLFISVKTVHSHLDRIGEKTGQRRRPDLVRLALQHGIGAR